MERFVLLVDNRHGIYVPEVFVCSHVMEQWNIKAQDALVLKSSIDWKRLIKTEEAYSSLFERHNYFIEVFGKNYLEYWEEIYWDTWEHVLGTAVYTNENGEYRLYLGESGDLFAEKIMDDMELAEWIAQENGLDVAAFQIFCQDSDFFLSDDWDAARAVDAFREQEVK